MDPYTAGVLSLAIGGAIGLLGRALTVWSNVAKERIETEAETARLKSAWHQQMTRKRQKAKKNDDQDDDQDDDSLVQLVKNKQIRTFIDGFLESADVDVDKLAAGDRKEVSKIQAIGKHLRGSMAGGGEPVIG